jgi:cobaltochelatase CobS
MTPNHILVKNVRPVRVVAFVKTNANVLAQSVVRVAFLQILSVRLALKKDFNSYSNCDSYGVGLTIKTTMTNDEKSQGLNQEIEALQKKQALLAEQEESDALESVPETSEQLLAEQEVDSEVPQVNTEPTSKKKWIPKDQYIAKLKAEGKYKPYSAKSTADAVANITKAVNAPKPRKAVTTPSVVAEPNVDIQSLVPENQNVVNMTDILEAMEHAVKDNMPVLLVGETGTAKTTLVKQLAYEHNQPLLRLNLNGNTTTDEFTGKMTLSPEGTKYIYGLFTRAVKYGYWILLDEVNASRPEILFVIQAVLERHDNGTLTAMTLAENEGEVIQPHANFRVFATMNPSDGYVGVNELNRATKGRFPVTIQVDYPDTSTEVKIVKSKLPKTPRVSEAEINDAVLLAQDIRNGQLQGEYEYGLSTRDLIQWFQVNENYGNLVESAKYTILGKLNKEDCLAVGSILKVYFSANTNVKATDGKTDQKYRKSQVLQVCDEGIIEVHSENRYQPLGIAKSGSVFEVTQIKGGKTFARLLRGEVRVPSGHANQGEFNGEPNEKVELSHNNIIRLENVQKARTRRVDTADKR